MLPPRRVLLGVLCTAVYSGPDGLGRAQAPRPSRGRARRRGNDSATKGQSEEIDTV